jgi:SAM-dependent methyltransferase
MVCDVTSSTPDPDPVDLTLAAYSSSAARYLEGIARPPSTLLAYLDRFSAMVGPGPVLEIGSGPGWDADHLEERGVTVVRSDAVVEFVRLLRDAGHEARVIDVRHDDLGGPYRGVLADAVLLHLTTDQMRDALRRLRDAVEPDGFLGVTLKEGDGAEWRTEKIDQPRFFQYWREPALRDVLAAAGWDVVSLEHRTGLTAAWLLVIARRRSGRLPTHQDERPGDQGAALG